MARDVLRDLGPQLLGLFHVIVEPPSFCRISTCKRIAGLGIGQRENCERGLAQEEGPVGHDVEKGPVVTGYDDRHVAGGGGKPGLQNADTRQVEMVGRLIHQEDDLAAMRAAHPGIGEEVYEVLGVDRSVASRTSYGGTAPLRVREQVRRWQAALG